MLKNINIKESKTFRVLIVILWMCLLIKTDSYYVNYLLLGLISLFCIFNKINTINTDSRREFIITIIFSIVLSLFVAISNYSFGMKYGFVYTLITVLMIFLFGIIVFYYFLIFIYFLLNRLYKNVYTIDDNISSVKVFLYTFIVLLVVYSLVLFLSQYPGDLNPDNINQINQIVTGHFINNHPYWHTFLIKIFFDLGLSIFGEINAAVATYSFFQIIVFSLIVSFSNMTLKQYGTNTKINIIFCLFFALVPYNYLYSISMLKDVLFGIDILLFITCLFRVLNNIGNKIINYFLLIVGSFGFGLLRLNGWYALVLTFVIFIFLKFKNKFSILLIIIVTIFSTFIMSHSMLDKLNVEKTEIVDSLCVPLQQIARVIVDDNALNTYEYEMLNKVVEVNKIKDVYLNYNADPMKALIRETNNQEYLTEHIGDYLGLYLKLGLKYPLSYFLGFVDQTKGYYNSGYPYWVWSAEVYQNSLGIKQRNTIPFFTYLIHLQTNSHYYFSFFKSYY